MKIYITRFPLSFDVDYIKSPDALYIYHMPFGTHNIEHIRQHSTPTLHRHCKGISFEHLVSSKRALLSLQPIDSIGSPEMQSVSCHLRRIKQQKNERH